MKSRTILISLAVFVLDCLHNPVSWVLSCLSQELIGTAWQSFSLFVSISLSDLIFNSSSLSQLLIPFFFPFSLNFQYCQCVLACLLYGVCQDSWQMVFLYALASVAAYFRQYYIDQVVSLQAEVSKKNTELSEIFLKKRSLGSNRKIVHKLSAIRARRPRRSLLEAFDNISEDSRSEADSIDLQSGQDVDTDLTEEELSELIQNILNTETINIYQQDSNPAQTISKVKSKLIQPVNTPTKHSHNIFKLEKKDFARMGTTIEENEAVYEFLESFGEWNFDTLGMGTLTQKPLKEAGHYIFTTMGIKEQFKIPTKNLLNFMNAIDAKYTSGNFYHNAFHAADVTNSTVFLMRKGLQQCGKLLDIDIFALVTAAMCHDIAHPGVNNAYLIGSQNRLALKYNDQSVLENMHAALTFKLLHRAETNIVDTLSKDDYLAFRRIAVLTILSTDLQKHFMKLNEFRSFLEKEELPDFDNDDFRLLCLQVVIKCADLGHGAKTLSIHQRWSALITKEFYAQGDKQREYGMPVDSMFDRNTNNIAESQCGFLNFLVKPIFDLYTNFVLRCNPNSDEMELTICVHTIEENIQYWINEKTEPTFSIE